MVGGRKGRGEVMQIYFNLKKLIEKRFSNPSGHHSHSSV